MPGCSIPADRLALRLGQDGQGEAIHLEETDTTFAIAWKGRYCIEGLAFIYSDRDTGRMTAIPGYPIDKLDDLAEKFQIFLVRINQTLN